MALTEYGEHIIEEANVLSDKMKSEVRSFTPPCPEHKSLNGKWIGLIGSMGKVFNVYECPEKDRFMYDRLTETGQLISERYYYCVRTDI
jgi:hypothetical protein